MLDRAAAQSTGSRRQLFANDAIAASRVTVRRVPIRARKMELLAMGLG